jgi:hypothetical protein
VTTPSGTGGFDAGQIDLQLARQGANGRRDLDAADGRMALLDHFVRGGHVADDRAGVGPLLNRSASAVGIAVAASADSCAGWPDVFFIGVLRR